MFTESQRQQLFDQFIDELVTYWEIAKQDADIAEQNKTPEEIMAWLIKEVESKIKSHGKPQTWDLKLECNPSEKCVATIKGEPSSIHISGKTRLVGTVTCKGEIVTIFQRFIGKTFYQYVAK